MIKTLEETQEEIGRWHGDGGVGQIICHTAPGGKIEVWEKPTFKRKNLDDVTAKTCDWLLKNLAAWRIEIHSGVGGACEHVTVVRKL